MPWRPNNSPIVLPEPVVPTTHHLRKIDGVACLAYDVDIVSGSEGQWVVVTMGEAHGIGTLQSFQDGVAAEISEAVGNSTVLTRHANDDGTHWRSVRRAVLRAGIHLGAIAVTYETLAKPISPHDIRQNFGLG